ncbi:MAG TPA: hypothetical protein VH637_10735 [Streptosporangiaceae bacterium]|jgi:hypothetical protein
MLKLILGAVVAIVLVMVALAVVHAVFSLVFWAALVALIAFGVFRIGKWSSRRSGRRQY